MENTNMNTGLVRLTFANVWTPRDSFGEDKYSATLLIPKTDKVTIAKLKECIENAKVNGADKLNGAKKVKSTLKDGNDVDADGEEYPEEYKGHYALNTSSKRQPGIVNKNLEKILDQNEVYSGCYVVANINFYAYNSNGNKGIACGLNHIMKIKDGEHLGGVVSVDQAFSKVDISQFFEDGEEIDEDFANFL